MKNNTCVPCMTGVNCFSTGNTIENLQLKDGYWRSNKLSIEILPCPMIGACNHTKQTNSTNCTAGNEGNFIVLF